MLRVSGRSKTSVTLALLNSCSIRTGVFVSVRVVGTKHTVSIVRSAAIDVGSVCTSTTFVQHVKTRKCSKGSSVTKTVARACFVWIKAVDAHTVTRVVCLVSAPLPTNVLRVRME